MTCAADMILEAGVEPAFHHAPSARMAVARMGRGAPSSPSAPTGDLQAEDELAEEVPVALEYNGVAHAVMLATPGDLEEFALGFSLSEGILASPAEFYGVEIEHGAAGITARIDIAAGAFMRLKERRRALAGRTGCGLCGVDSLAQVIRPLPCLAPTRALSGAAIRRALAQVRQEQPLNRLTGATHAALWCGRDGVPRAAFEDVGRHNALDKLIGGLHAAGADLGDGFCLITSRASVEMVQKAATVGIAAMVAISAPTALAVRTALECGMTLVAFARGDNFVAYAHGVNIDMESA
ncbi:formate dehydrogenase accessory sulfurtransferase FdhD [Massilia sp. YIM B02443]|uniref:formate dehydrogenase accessory sulfurtransferase FdhD n=1 Tax=Massilia sp. YIM B02443 TaxID=3050127 RepID=UPI0025B71782|nr:formate dehydrogenase accessory sulfurtransferase FdhD [Massilia sp. YIM B02443]MDN4036656.1 formate dehydrogenase accessory sulfurtransferase FdhD [Massilia sp. YIM B02443]